MKSALRICFLVVVLNGLSVNGQVLEEIIVTAQRREQSLQKVPISVTAFNGAAIVKANLKGAVDYLALTPNVSFTEDGQAVAVLASQ